jgi:hypothetical protein
MAKILFGAAALLAVILGFFLTIVATVQSQLFPMSTEQLQKLAVLTQVIGGISTAVALVIGLVTVIVTINNNRTTQRLHEKAGLKASLNANLREFGRLSIDWPEFARPSLLVNVKGDPKQFERYMQYVSIGLNVCEEAFRSGDLDYWGEAIKQFVLEQQGLIEDPEFQPTFMTYPKNFREHVQKIIRDQRNKGEAGQAKR